MNTKCKYEQRWQVTAYFEDTELQTPFFSDKEGVVLFNSSACSAA